MADINFVNLEELLSQVDWDTVTEDSGFEDLPEGFYLCELESGELKTNKAGTNKQASLRFKIIEDGVKEDIDNKGYSILKEIPSTKNRKIFKTYPFKDVAGIKRFVIDMVKFEAAEGQPILEKEYFMHEEIIPDALNLLVGSRIYIQAAKKPYNGQMNTWYDIVGWDRAKTMGLS